MSTRGQQDATSGMSEFNSQAFLIYQMIGRLNFSKMVKVLAVYNVGAAEPVGYVDIQPMVNQLDGNNNAEPFAPIYGVPYFRLQGGKNAIIIDPQVGDIGMAAFADRDISNVKKTKEISNPGSFRRYSLADAMYFGGLLNGTPDQFVRFSAEGIELVSPTKIRAAAPLIEFEATEKITLRAPLISENGA